MGELNDFTPTEFDHRRSYFTPPSIRPAPVLADDDPNIGDLIVISNENLVTLTPLETNLVDRNNRRDVILIRNFDRWRTRELLVQIDLNDKKQQQQQRRFEPDKINSCSCSSRTSGRTEMSIRQARRPFDQLVGDLSRKH